MENNIHESMIQETDIGPRLREEFINFLDSEITSLRSEIQRPGWTTYAILGSIAALVWLLLYEIQIGKFYPKNVAGIILVIWLIFSLCMNVSFLINPSRSIRKPKERFVPGYLISTERSILILLTGLQIFFIFVIIDFSPDVISLATIMAYFVISGSLLALVIIIAITFTNTPIPLNRTSNMQTKIGYTLSAIISTIPLWFYIKFLFISPGTANIFDLRFAILLAAIYYLTLLLMLRSRGNLTLDSLITIKREFF